MRETIHTEVGDIQVPDESQIGPRTKYWAGAVVNLVKVDQLYRVMAAALEEAFHAGELNAMAGMMQGMSRDVIDVEARVIDEAEQGTVEGRTEEHFNPGQLAESQADGAGERAGAAPAEGSESEGAAPSGSGS